jgi:hypothetical protein
MPHDAVLESLLEYLIDDRINSVHVDHRRRVEELRPVGVHPAVLPVEQGEERATRRIRVLSHGLPGGFGDRHQRHPRRTGQALLRADDAYVDAPLVHEDLLAPERRHGVDQQQGAGVLDGGRDLRHGVVDPRGRFGLDDRHELYVRVVGQRLPYGVRVDRLVVGNAHLDKLGAVLAEPVAEPRRVDAGHEVERLHARPS